MIDFEIWRKGWALLDARERRNAWITLAVAILGTILTALMVGSVLPILSVSSNPDQIQRVPALAWAYETFGFVDDYAFLVALGLGSCAVIIVTRLKSHGDLFGMPSNRRLTYQK